MSDRLLTVTEVADLLHLSRQGVWKKVKAGQIGAFRAGHKFLIREEEIYNYIRRCNSEMEDECDG